MVAGLGWPGVQPLVKDQSQTTWTNVMSALFRGRLLYRNK